MTICVTKDGVYLKEDGQKGTHITLSPDLCEDEYNTIKFDDGYFENPNRYPIAKLFNYLLQHEVEVLLLCLTYLQHGFERHRDR